ncbi:cytochrome b/b6 domain-containing protein [Zwartia panacis]|uniref:cytochrome b/b6 domain-containing protein n=1 Tax=Zwartia panacis TaxID=2683345 RepID=UPI0025B5A94C|nr:cytochrome b/b6 domain-containing protein [Zwartia panacis]MDN4016134.1 cytochrome b/b6 domain-containing protein [Zwartia panacis]
MDHQAHHTIAPLFVRVTHWLNALAVIVMIMSGLKIYNASPIFDFLFPRELTVGGWLGGALLWHFAFMWLLVVNGLIYLTLNFYTGRAWKKFFPISPKELIKDVLDTLKGKLAHEDLSKYNTIQKLAYLSVILDIVILIASGLAIWKSVQFPILRDLMGGFDNARVVHFAAMSFAVFFILVHLLMVALVPRTLLIMTRGK